MVSSLHKTDFSQLDMSLQRAKSIMSPAGTHGLLCGMVCATGRLDAGQWLDEVFENADAGSRVIEDCRNALLDLAEVTVQQLNDPELGFVLLLPDEDESLSLRATALVDWSRNYLYGLALGGLGGPAGLPDDVAEIIRDLSEISRADPGGDHDEGEAENALEEIIEYVRMGVLLVNEELQPLKAPQALQ